jgi:hypothetical protein
VLKTGLADRFRSRARAVERILASSIWPFHLLEIGPGVEIKFPISQISYQLLGS